MLLGREMAGRLVVAGNITESANVLDLEKKERKFAIY